jgi:predicted PurR-regulated permease PerM
MRGLTMFLKLWDAKAGRILFTALAFLLVLAFLFGETITLFLFAIFFAYLVDPIVSRLQKPLRGRGKAILVFYLLFIGALVGLGFLLGPRIVEEGRSLISSLPTLLDRMASGQFIVALAHNEGWDQAAQHHIQQFFMNHRNEILNYTEDIIGQLRAPLYHIWWLILIPILSIFFLKNGSQIAQSLINLGREGHDNTQLKNILADVHNMLGSYIRAQLILAALTAIALTLVLGLMRVPYSFVLSPLAGICEFVPVVGPAIACITIFGIAGITGYTHLVWLFLFLATWRVIQDYVNAPRIMGQSVRISQLAEIFCVLAGGEIAGVAGAMVAVPLLAVLRILWRDRGADTRKVHSV